MKQKGNALTNGTNRNSRGLAKNRSVLFSQPRRLEKLSYGREMPNNVMKRLRALPGILRCTNLSESFFLSLFQRAAPSGWRARPERLMNSSLCLREWNCTEKFCFGRTEKAWCYF